MQHWINFFILVFWLIIFLLLFNPSNFVIILFSSELLWITLYTLTLCLGINTDLLFFFVCSFLFLSLAGIEFSIGLVLIILFKETNTPLTFKLNTTKVDHSFFKLQNYKN